MEISFISSVMNPGDYYFSMAVQHVLYPFAERVKLTTSYFWVYHSIRATIISSKNSCNPR